MGGILGTSLRRRGLAGAYLAKEQTLLATEAIGPDEKSVTTVNAIVQNAITGAGVAAAEPKLPLKVATSPLAPKATATANFAPSANERLVATKIATQKPTPVPENVATEKTAAGFSLEAILGKGTPNLQPLPETVAEPAGVDYLEAAPGWTDAIDSDPTSNLNVNFLDPNAGDEVFVVEEDEVGGGAVTPTNVGLMTTAAPSLPVRPRLPWLLVALGGVGLYLFLRK